MADATHSPDMAEMNARKAERMQILAMACRRLYLCDSHASLTRTLVEIAIEVVGATSGMAGFYENNRMVFSEYCQKGVWQAADYSYAPGEGVPGWIIQQRKSYISNDAQYDPNVDQSARNKLGFSQLIDTPVISDSGTLIGCFHIHDSCEGRDFDDSDIQLLEILSHSAVLAFSHIQQMESQHAMHTLLELSLLRLPLVEKLEQALETILAVSWLSLQSKGSVFLFDDENNELVMKVSKGLSAELESKCARLQMGQCLCGRAADTQKTVFSLCLDEEHKIRSQDMTNHGHYCLPMMWNDKLVGVLNAYTDAFHARDEHEVAFLQDAATLLAGVVHDELGHASLQRAKDEYQSISSMLRRMCDTMPDMIWVKDLDCRYIFANKALCNNLLHAVDAQEPVGKQDMFFALRERASMPEDSDWHTFGELCQDSDTITMQSGKPMQFEEFGNVRGKFLLLDVHKAPLYDEQGELIGVVGSGRDVTRERELEIQFLQAQKMEAIGTLVGGIAHDFNNMLAGISGNIYLAKSALVEASPARMHMDRIEDLSFRATDMISQLLTFARKGDVDLRVFDISSFIKESFKLYTASLPENIHLDTALSSKPLLVKGDATQFQQILVNLLGNARDALDGVENPVIQVNLDSFFADEAFLNTHQELQCQHFAHLCVHDNGCGIASEHLDNIFEPFFTTKEVGKGTGLGLSMVYGAVKTHKGVVEVHSEFGCGTEVHIYLPLEQSADAKPVLKDAELEVEQGNGEGILLVDDDAQVLETGQDVLQSLGYRVFCAANGLEAIALYKSHQHEIALVILDMVMPKMGGVEAAQQICAFDDRAKVIFSTGYDKDRQENPTGFMDNKAILSKPYTIPELSRIIQQYLA